MNIVIVGLGKVGQLLTQYLSDEGHNLVVIDHNDQKVENFVNQFDVLGICGNGANYHVLEEANVQDADIVIAVTSSDELNILSCLMAKQIGAKHLIARVRNPDYSAQKDVFINQLGFAMIINPELEAAKDIRRTLMFSSAIRIDTFAKGKAEMIELRITEKNRLCHTSLNELNQLTRAHILIAAMRRQEEVIIPNGEDVFEVNDHIHVIGTHQDLIRFCIDTGFTTKSLKHVMIIGGSKIAYYLAQQLNTFGIHTKIIEQNHQRCIELSQQLPEATIIEGDGSNEDLLIEEELPHHDAMVCLTGLDEENIVLGLVAKQIGVQKAIAKVNHRSLGNSIIDQLGIDSIVDT